MRLLAAALFALAAACVRVTPQVTPSGPALLAVVTWNMHAGRGDLPRLLDDLTAGRLTSAPPRNYVVLLQEAIEGTRADVRTIGAERRLSSYFSPVRVGAALTSGNAVLSTLPLENPRAIALPVERQPRGAVLTAIRLEGQPFFVAATHLENRLAFRRGLVFADRARGRQAVALLRAIPASGPGVLGGDLNTMLGPREPALRVLLARFPDTPPHDAPSYENRLALDHVFFDLPDGWYASRQVIADRYESDHNPVIGLVTGLRPRELTPE